MISGLPEWPPASLERVLTCPVCKSEDRTVMHAQLIDDTFHAAPGHWMMQRCSACGSGYLDPRPTADSIGAAYVQYYTHAAGPRVSGPGLKAALRGLANRVTRAYFASLRDRTPAGNSPLDTFLAAALRSLPFCRELIDAQYRHLRRPEPGSDRLLDIGCGNGEFLARARDLGWQVEGVDFDPKAVAAARAAGLEVRIGSIESYSRVREQFDVVTCSHVIEHVYDAHQLVATIHQILKPGGRLWVETPNIESAGHAVFGKSWRGLEAPRHLCIFNFRTLSKLLVDAGFEITHTTPWNIQKIRYMFGAAEAIAAGRSPDSALPLVPNLRLLRGLLLEGLRVEKREFVSLRAVKPV
jgi:SAM-dependent methyltransferase